MGHKNATETLDIYAHLFPDDDDLGRGVVAAAFQNLHAGLHVEEQ